MNTPLHKIVCIGAMNDEYIELIASGAIVDGSISLSPKVFLKRILFLLLSAVFVWSSALADGLQSHDLAHLSIEQLMDMPVAVASGKDTKLREAPGIVTVITSEEIQNSGARDLMDVLSLVPGLQFGVDVQGVIGLASRGLWAHEGKALLLWNGHEMNELLYSTLQFGSHFPMGQIKKIEIIRGPGSVLYGGFAELTVIDIITDGPEDLHGGKVSVTYGQTAHTIGHKSLQAIYGEKYESVKYDLGIFSGDGPRSDRRYTDLQGSSYNMSHSSDLRPLLATANVNVQGLDLRFLYDGFHMTERDEFGENLTSDVGVDFSSYYFDARYPAKLTPSLTVTPRLSHKIQWPWHEKLAQGSGNLEYRKKVERTTADVLAEQEVSSSLTAQLGAQYYTDRAQDEIDGGQFFNGESSFDYYNYAAFGQLLADLEVVNLVFGLRYEKNELFDSKILPRFSLTEVFDRAHVKFLASAAFRSPTTEAINGNHRAIDNNVPDVGPIDQEDTKVLELEGGHKLGEKIYVTANVFQEAVHDPIAYFVDPATGTEGYQNLAEVGSRGVEAEMRWRDVWGYANLSYSYYQAHNTDAPTYEVPDHDHDLLGVARDKIAANISVRVAAEVTMNPSLVFYGRRFGYASADLEGNSILSSFDPRTMLNLNFAYTPAQLPSVRVDASVYNILNQNFDFIQPYTSGHAPLPSLSREFLLRLTYIF